ncbi:MAG: pyridoxal phosphate-dependent aminotransferase [Immundisolibacter sp.]|uniref:pyridoxal phosphate-dependent aminotransferase n=1 Tax=Immundisolibacter sp. TaxID=1934948 RepID=UPI0019B3FA2F|nr:pyridoxal phosphate-dependent aminotransferase [Immundisolibacter sp.]MBC7160701.1 pyridoxal phosphate-dependent aminotransferase [Immundisolibacter sp.]
MTDRFRPATRIADIAPFHVMEVMGHAQAAAAAGRDIVHMEVGEPDFATVEPIVEAGIRALRDGHTHYTLALGLPALREAIADFYRTRHGVAVEPRQVVVTVGASGALQLALWALIGPGDEVLLTDPGYPCNRHFARLAGGVPVELPVGPDTGWQPTAAQIEAALTPRTRAVLLASPANPTGAVIDREELARIAALLRQRRVALIADEIYHGLIYDADTTTALACDADAIVVNSFSKYFGMTGWRLGWAVVPEALVRPVEKLAQNLFIAPPTPAQHAALAAFEPATLALLDQRRDEFRARRDLLLPALRGFGFDIPVTPQGAFYIYAGCGRFADDSSALCLRLLDQGGVAATPGLDFGPHTARTHLRFAYTTSRERLGEAIDRLGRLLA